MNLERDIVATLKFSGKRFRNGAFDLSAGRELERFQKVVLETAKFLWRQANPGASKLPRRFDERISLSFRRTEIGSSVVPIEYSSNSNQHELVDINRTSVTDAIDLSYDIVAAIDGNQLVPEYVPWQLLAAYRQLGKGLYEDEVMEFSPLNKQPIQFRSEFTTRLKSRLDTTYEDVIDIFVSVYQVNMRTKTFLFESDYGDATQVSFDDEHSERIIQALSKCGSRWLRICGRGRFDDKGRLDKVFSVERVTYVTEPLAKVEAYWGC